MVENEEKPDVMFQLPKLDWFGAQLDTIVEDQKVTYEGKLYDLKPVFQKPDVKQLYIFGRANLRKIVNTTELKKQKPSVDNFAPQEISVENSSEEWFIGDTEKSDKSRLLLFSGWNKRTDYREVLYTSAWNHGIWIRPKTIIEPIFNKIETEISQWYRQVYKIFNVEVNE